MKKEPSFYDAEYFGHVPTEGHRSNYPELGGYVDSFAKAEEVVDLVLSEVTDVHKVLDLGCAHGATVRAFKARGIDCYGVDCSEYIISVAAEDIKNYLYVGDMHDLPLALRLIAPFDIVCSKDVLEHSDEESIDNLLLHLSSMSSLQIHFINTAEYDYQLATGDESHTLLRPLDWWISKFQSLNLKAILKCT